MRGFPCELVVFLVAFSSWSWVAANNPSDWVNSTALEGMEIPMPPYILIPERQTTLYISSEATVHLRCVARGSPRPKYEWTWNGNVINTDMSNTALSPQNGTLTISAFSFRKEGYYQCKAKNAYGVSLSQVYELRKKVIPKFQNDGNLKMYTVQEGRGVALECYSRPLATPKGPYNWYTVDPQTQTQAQIHTHTSDRMDIDANGTLYITRADMSDQKDTYACAALTKELDLVVVAKTPYIGLKVVKNKVQDMRPNLLGSSVYVAADKGGQVTLECFFDGEPKPNVTWRYGDRNVAIKNETENRFFMSSLAHKLTIRRLVDDDQGHYICTAGNKMGSASATIFLNVTSRPLFQTDSPRSIIAPVGSNATFSCHARGSFQERALSPPEWYINGIPLPMNESQISFNDDRTELTVLNVTKDDLMNIQCNVSNSQGYAFGDGYLTVINPLEILLKPDDEIEVEENSTQIQLTVEASSDACCPVSFLWSHNGQFLTKSELHTPPYSYLAEHNAATLFIQLRGATREEAEKLMGNYRCDVWHSAYSDNKTVTVALNMKVYELPTQAPIKVAEATYWWIALVGGIIGLLVAAVAIVLMIRFNYPGQEYLLAKEEKKHKLNPEKDILDQSFEEI